MHLAQFCNIKRIRTSPYRPSYHRTIINMLKTLDERNKSNGEDHLQKLVRVSNCTTHSSNRYSPYYYLVVHQNSPSIWHYHLQQLTMNKQPIYLILKNERNRWDKHMKLQTDNQCRVSQKMLSNIMVRDWEHQSCFQATVY